MKPNLYTLVLVVFALFLLSASCKKKNALEGVDTNALFAPPLKAEIEAVKRDWQSRQLMPQEIRVEASHAIKDDLAYKLISFRLHGKKQYAGVLVPTTTTPIPVMIQLSGFGLDMPLSSHAIQLAPNSNPPFIFVLPALSGQSLSLSVNGTAYTSPVSEGARHNAFDGAADDAIAALNAVASLFTNADTSRMMTRGGSRGGTVALLLGIRDQRVKRAVGVAFPADFVTLTASHQNDPTYKFQFLDSLIAGQRTLAQTRLNLIASSPLYFVDQLPKSQLHFGEKDVITAPAQGELIVNALKARGLQERAAFFVYAGKSHNDIGNNNAEMEQRINAFFGELY